MFIRNFAICTGLLLTSFNLAHAGYKIYAPKVEKGETEIETQFSYAADDNKDQDGAFTQIYGIEYGFTNWWKSELGFEVEKEHNGENHKLEAVKWENIFAPWKQGENFIDVGFYAEIEKATRDGEPNKGEVKLLLGKNIGNFVTLANISAEREFGPHNSDDTDTDASFHARYKINKNFQPGIEYFASLGPVNDYPSYNEQGHSVGPVIYGHHKHLKYDAGILFGASKAAPDTVIKLNLGYEF